MSSLNCSAKECGYYKDDLCERNHINVGGKQAHRTAETCCESFENQSVGKHTAMKADENTGIHCEAQNCEYNENETCVAKHVQIQGCNAEVCGETCCETFCER